MKVFRSLEEVKSIQPTVVALGNFDGIHRGHQELIRRTVKSARIAGLKSAVFTFTNHPKNVMTGTSAVKNILYLEEKMEVLKSLGVSYMFTPDFTPEIQHLDPVDFVKKLLVDTFRMKEAYCGFNYRFGFKAQGTPEVLMREGLKYDFGLHVLEPFKLDGRVVSSTLIRELIAEGEVEQCARYLGRLYSIGGTVVVGNKIGRTIGFPTLNITIDDSMVTPSHGVYITRCTFDGQTYNSLTNVGMKPTIGNYNKNVETHIFDFNQEIYGKNIRVDFMKKIRDEYKFASVEALAAQIQKDCMTAKEYHEKQK